MVFCSCFCFLVFFLSVISVYEVYAQCSSNETQITISITTKIEIKIKPLVVKKQQLQVKVFFPIMIMEFVRREKAFLLKAIILPG